MQNIWKWRWKNEEEEDEELSALFKYFYFWNIKTLERVHFKSVFGFFISFLDQKLWLAKIGKKGVKSTKIGILGLLWHAVTFQPGQMWKFWLHILNQLSLKFLCTENEQFLPCRKKVDFFHLHFSSSFSIFLKRIFQLQSSTCFHLSIEVSLIHISFLD